VDQDARVRDVHRRGARERDPAPQVREPLVVLRNEVERLAVEHRRLILRPAALGLLGHLDEVTDRALTFARVPPVTGERGRGFSELGGRLLEELDARVALAAVGPREELVRRNRGSARA
jgi:hypothetical protein